MSLDIPDRRGNIEGGIRDDDDNSDAAWSGEDKFDSTTNDAGDRQDTAVDDAGMDNVGDSGGGGSDGEGL